MRRSRVESLPEDAERVRAFDAALRRHRSEVVDVVHAHRAAWRRRSVTMLEKVGLPLRPLFLHRHHVDFIARGLHRAFGALFASLKPHARDPAWLQHHIPLPPNVWRALDVRAGLASPTLRAILRPDGFLFEDRYVLSEVNFGNGTIVSNTYTEALSDSFRRSPAFRELGWDLDAHLPRPFQGYVEMIRRLLPKTSRRPLVAMLAHSYEWKTILDYPKRVVQQIRYAQRRIAEAGIDTRIVTEDELAVDARGRVRLDGERRSADLVLLITIGTSFMDEPWRLQPGDDLDFLRGARVGRVPLAKPLVSLGFDKGTLPYFATLPVWPVRRADGFRLEVAETRYPRPRDEATLVRRQPDWVLKKAFDGKDTHVGISAKRATWRKVAAHATHAEDYVAQRYTSMPRTHMPVLVDDRHIEWLPVRVEVSPFIFEGRFGGAIARYAPDAEGLVLSPPGDDMGLTMVFR